MFDCVMPTRIARHGAVYTSQGRLTVRNGEYAMDLHLWIRIVIVMSAKIMPGLYQASFQ